MNADNPLSHDSNHGLILKPEENPQEILQDLIGFYRGQGITPRLYSAQIPAEETLVLPALEERGFTISFSGAKFMILKRPSEITPRPDISVEEVTAWREEIGHLVLSDPGEGIWTVKALKRLVASCKGRVFLACRRSEPVAIASVSLLWGVGRVDNVFARRDQRGRGYGSTLIHRLAEKHLAPDLPLLYLWAENPVARRIYRKAGFRQVSLPFRQWTAWLPR